MASTRAPYSDPLTESQVLEQEYESLYGELPPGYAKWRDNLLRREREELEQAAQAQGSCAAGRGAARPRRGALTAYDVRVACDAEIRRRLLQHVHERAESPLTAGPPRSALCLSGGGIRSATFALGVLQGLAKYGLLKQFDYLSTVSGGGYVGSWLSAWIHRSRDGTASVFAGLAASAGRPTARPAPPPGAPPSASSLSDSVPGPGPVQVRHLRDYSNYLTPRVGLLRPDSWTLAASYLRNLLLHWLVLIPLIAGILLVPRLYLALLVYARHVFPDPQANNSDRRLVTLVVVSLCLQLIAIVVAILGLPSANPPRRAGRPRRSGAVLAVVMTAIFVGALINSFVRPLAQPLNRDMLAFCLQNGAYYGVAAAIAAVAIRMRKTWTWSRVAALVLGVLVGGVAVALVATIVRSARVLNEPDFMPRVYATYTVPLSVGLYLLLLTLYVGLTSWRPGGDEDREWVARLMAWMLMVAVVWVVAFVISLWGPYWLQELWGRRKTFWSMVAAATVTGLLGLIGGRNDATPAARSDFRPSRDWSAAFLRTVAAVSAQFLVLTFMILVAAALNQLMRAFPGPQMNFARQYPLPVGFFGDPIPPISTAKATLSAALITGAALAGCGLFFGVVMNSNRLSLHAVYRDRLVRAYLGASNAARDPDPFTGFDPEDNLPMHHLRRGRFFNREDLVGDGDGDGSDRWDRVDGVARLITDHKVPFLKYLWEKAATQVPTLNALRTEDSEGRARFGPDALEPVLKALETFVADPDLLERSPFADADVRGRHPDIDWAYRQLENDGCAHLLNRLILEEEFFEEIRPAVERDRAGGPGRAAATTAAVESTQPDTAGADQGAVAAAATSAPPLRVYYLKPLTGRALVPKPFHVVNVALNLVHGRELAAQQRKAESFTISPLHCGFPKGYRRSVEYGESIKLGTAMTISGAAASPNMGYHSSPAVTFLMTLFNLRLGWWLGNPARVSERWVHRVARKLGLEVTWGADGHSTSYRRADARHSLLPLINEALGRTTDKYSYVYLSDGGHFENLGLYEMVRRRCHLIVVSDATRDPECNFGDLGNAIRKVQVDFGIPVTIDEILFYPKTQPKGQGKYCALGTIHYSAVDKMSDGRAAPDGHLIYLKPARHEREPVDVFNHGETSRHFPHEPTSNQWFTEAQFESYRKVGLESIEAIMGRRGSAAQGTQGSAEGNGPLRLDDFRCFAGEEARPPGRANRISVQIVSALSALIELLKGLAGKYPQPEGPVSGAAASGGAAGDGAGAGKGAHGSEPSPGTSPGPLQVQLGDLEGFVKPKRKRRKRKPSDDGPVAKDA